MAIAPSDQGANRAVCVTTLAKHKILLLSRSRPKLCKFSLSFKEYVTVRVGGGEPFTSSSGVLKKNVDKFYTLAEGVHGEGVLNKRSGLCATTR